ncbi:MAG: hypothetical protein GF417_01695, partial [Candidatus Latescibacteria bacterium]|nr:hypothetical protein [bacterium]MBD3423140.1 hypothetical protein [Candidatus Latescibacterota bacterium]
MPLTGNFSILSRIRESGTSTISSFLMAADSALREEYEGVAATAVELTGEKYIVLFDSSSIGPEAVEKLFGLGNMGDYRKRVISGEGSQPQNLPEMELIRIPLSMNGDKCALFHVLAERKPEPVISPSAVEELAEVLSIEVCSRILQGQGGRPGNQSRELKLELIEGICDSKLMRVALERAMELTGAQISAFYTGTGPRKIDIMLDGRELAPLVPFITSKTINAYGCYANSKIDREEYREKVYYRQSQR